MSDRQSGSGDRNIEMRGRAAAPGPDVQKLTKALATERPDLIPMNLNRFFRVVNSIQDFWLTVVKLPPKL
jgi:hypothetical protein